MSKNYVEANQLFLFDSATLTPAFQVASVAFPAGALIVRIINTSNVGVFVSYDGITENDYVPANTSLTLNFQTNSQPSSYVCLMKKGTIIYLSAPGVGMGDIYTTCYFQSN